MALRCLYRPAVKRLLSRSCGASVNASVRACQADVAGNTLHSRRCPRLRCRGGSFVSWRALYSDSVVPSRGFAEALRRDGVHESHPSLCMASHHRCVVGLSRNVLAHVARSTHLGSGFDDPWMGLLAERSSHVCCIARASPRLARVSGHRRHCNLWIAGLTPSPDRLFGAIIFGARRWLRPVRAGASGVT